MKITTFLSLKVLVASLLLTLGSVSHAQTGDPIGLILSTSGSVSAEAEDGTVRKLRRRSPVFEGDTVVTGTRSRAQIRFNDNGLVALQPGTRFVIEEHRFNGQEDGTESAAYRLLRGGMQAITGLIGNRNKNRYRFETPLATIGLRGTHWAATFCSTTCDGLPPGLYGGVAEGGIDVCNGGGCEGFDQDGYFYVPDADTPAQSLLNPPSVVFDDTTSSRDEEGEEGESEEGSEESEGSADSGEDSESDGTQGEGEGAGGEESDGQQADTGEQGDGTEAEDDVTLFGGTGDDSDTGVDPIGGGVDSDDTSLGEDFGEIGSDSDPVRCSNDAGAANSCDTDITGDGEDTTFSIIDLQSGEAEQIIDEELMMGDTDGDDDVSDPIDDPIDDDVPEPSYNAELGSELSETGVAVVAATASIEGAGEEAFALTVLPSIGDQLRIFQIDGVNTLVGFDIVEFDDFAGTQIDCDPCLQIEQAFYDDLGTYTSAAFSADYGRWLQAETLASLTDFDTLELIELGIRPDIHFGYSEDQTLELPDLDMPLIATYSYVAGTSPTDELGNVGSVMDITMDLDFYQQAIVGFDLELEVGDRSYVGMIDPSNSSVQIYEDYLEDIEIDLVGYCQGGDCGDFFNLEGETSLVFLGENAEGVLGSYALNTWGADLEYGDLGDLPFIGVTGAYVLETDGPTENPLYFLLDDQTEFVAPQPDAVLVSGNLVDCMYGCYYGYGQNYYGYGIFPEANTFSPDEFNSAGLVSLGGFDNLPTIFAGYEGENHVTVNEAVLAEYGMYVFSSGAEVSWGRWFTTDFDYLYSQDSSQFMLPELHFGYSESLASMPSIGDEETSVIVYSLVGATSPTDHSGQTGTLHSVDLALNFYSDSVAAFNMDLSIGEAHYLAELDNADSYDLNDLISGGLELELTGSCFGDDCGYSSLYGYAELNLIGENTDAGLAEGILGAYGLYTSFNSYQGYEYYGSYSYANYGQAATGVFVLEQYESPLVINSSSLVSSSSDMAGFIGVTGIEEGSLFPVGFLSIPELDQGDIPSDIYTSPIPATLDLVDLTTLDGEIVSAVVGATISEGTESSLGVQEGVLVEYGILGEEAGLEIYWGGWIGDVAVTEAGMDIGDEYVSYLHYVYTDDWTETLPDFAAETFEVWYHYAGGPSPVDGQGFLGNVHYVDMAVNFASQSVSYFGASMAIDGSYYTGTFDPNDSYFNGSDTTFYDLNGIWTANVPLLGAVGDCGSGCGPGYEENYVAINDLVGSATVALAGTNAEAALGTLALYDDDVPESSATLSFVLQQQGFEYLFLDEFDDTSFIRSTDVVAAVANIRDLTQDDLGYSGVATVASNTEPGEFAELFFLDGAQVGFINAYGTDGPSSTVIEGQSYSYGTQTFGRNQDSNVYWGLWLADQSFTYAGTSEEVVDILPWASTNNATTNMPTSPIVSNMDLNPELKAEYHFWAGDAFNELGEIAQYFDVDMTIDYLNQQISEFDVYATTYGSGYYGYVNYYASIDGDGYGEGMGYVDLMGLDPADIQIPLAGMCSGCGISTYDALMQGTANLALVGPNGEAAVGSFYLDSTEYYYYGEDATGLYSLAGAFTLDQDGDGHYFDSTTPITNSLSGVAVGAAIADASSVEAGDLAVSGITTDPVGLVTLVGDGHTHPNAVVSGSFTGNVLGVSQTIDINAPTEAILDNYGNTGANDGSYEAYWGRWLSYDQSVEFAGQEFDAVGKYAYFGYSDDLITGDQLGALEASGAILHYGYNNYDSQYQFLASDQNGSSGYLQYADMQIDFGQSMIDSFYMSAYDGSENWTASASDVAITGATQSFAVTGDVGHNVGVATGTVNTAILGANADAVLGAYNLSDTTDGDQLIGNFLLEQGVFGE